MGKIRLSRAPNQRTVEQNQVSKFCIDLEGVMLPDAIAAVVVAWYDAQNVEVATTTEFYTVKELEKVLNRSRASVYRILNTGKDGTLNPLFDPYKLNYEHRFDIKDPICVSTKEIERWKKAGKPKKIKDKIEDKIEKLSDASCKEQVLGHVSKLIMADLLTVESKMPSTRDLANRIGFHRNSVAKVYEELEQDGAVVAKPGSGVYIKDLSKLTPANAF